MNTNDGRVVFPKDVMLDVASRWSLGPGSKTLNEGDCFALISLMQSNPTRSVRSYVNKLYRLTGTRVSRMTVSHFFKKRALHHPAVPGGMGEAKSRALPQWPRKGMLLGK